MIRWQSLYEIWGALEVFETCYFRDAPACPVGFRCFDRAWNHLCTKESLSTGSMGEITEAGRSTSCTPAVGVHLWAGVQGSPAPPCCYSFPLPRTPPYCCQRQWIWHTALIPSCCGTSFTLPNFLGSATYICHWWSLSSSASSVSPSASYPGAFSLRFHKHPLLWCLCCKVRSGNGEGSHCIRPVGSNAFWPFWGGGMKLSGVSGGSISTCASKWSTGLEECLCDWRDQVSWRKERDCWSCMTALHDQECRSLGTLPAEGQKWAVMPWLIFTMVLPHGVGPQDLGRE